MVVLGSFVVLAYLVVAGLSDQATVIPNTAAELARFAILVALAAAARWWGAVERTHRILEETDARLAEVHRSESKPR